VSAASVVVADVDVVEFAPAVVVEDCVVESAPHDTASRTTKATIPLLRRTAELTATKPPSSRSQRE